MRWMASTGLSGLKSFIQNDQETSDSDLQYSLFLILL